MKNILIYQVKISEDIRLVTERENNLEIKLNDIKDLEVSISKRESDINDKERDVSIKRRRYKNSLK
jgi:hypothetical protein